MNTVKKYFRWAIRVVVGVIFLSIAIVLISGLVECPETLAQLAIVLAVAIWMLIHFFKLLMPKGFTSAMNKERKRIWKNFWKYIF